MPRMTYFQLIHQTIDLYNEGRLEEAFDLLNENEDEVGGNRAQLLNFKYCIASRLGRDELAIKLLRESIVGTDYWYGYDYFYQDEDLKNIRDRAEFKEIVDLCREREARAKKEAKPELKVMLPDREHLTQRPWVVALHGNGDSVELTEGNWHPVLAKGYPLALLQSSQIQSYGIYTWMDIEKGMAELERHLSDLEMEHGMEPGGYILAGFSGGARLALHSVLHGGLRPRGLILVAPWLPELKEWEDDIRRLPVGGLRTCVICGDRDAISADVGKEAVRSFKEAGIPTMLHFVEGLGHDFPEDFSERLSDMLGFIGP